jgi:ATP-binding cassette subfamily B protein
MLTIGQLLLVMSYLAHLYSPLKSLVQELMKVQNGFTGLERIFNLFDKKYDVIERPNALTVKQVNGNIRFQDVSFSYDGKNNVLTNLSFDIPSGSRVGIIGRTGSGKTTLTSLLMRLYDPSSGTIFLDGVDLKDLKVRQLRDQFAVVLQEPILLTGSIADNIAYAYPDATDIEFIRLKALSDSSNLIRSLRLSVECIKKRLFSLSSCPNTLTTRIEFKIS